MRNFVAVSGLIFTFVCAAWTMRMILGLALRVHEFDIPMTISIVPIIVAGAMAAWALRLLRQAKG